MEGITDIITKQQSKYHRPQKKIERAEDVQKVLERQLNVFITLNFFSVVGGIALLIIHLSVVPSIDT